MDLFSLSVFSNLSPVVKKGWYFNGRTLMVIGPDRMNIPCGKVQRHTVGKSNRVYCGHLIHNCMLVMDARPDSNSDEFLLSIVNDGFIKIPFDLYDRVYLNGERKRDGAMSMSIIRLSKSEKTEFIIHVPGQKNRSIKVSYDFGAKRLMVEDGEVLPLPLPKIPELTKKPLRSRLLWKLLCFVCPSFKGGPLGL